MSFTRRAWRNGNVEAIVAPYVGHLSTRPRSLGGVIVGLFTRRADHAEHETGHGEDDVANLEHCVDAVDEPP